MTVEELISELRKWPKDSPVKLNIRGQPGTHWLGEATDVFSMGDNGSPLGGIIVNAILIYESDDPS